MTKLETRMTIEVRIGRKPESPMVRQLEHLTTGTLRPCPFT